MTTALITGAAGQDGILLARMLVADGVAVTGLLKPGTDDSQLRRYAPAVDVVLCDLGDPAALTAVLRERMPDQVFNLGGVSSIMESVENPELTHRVNVGAVETILSAMAERPADRPCRLVQAASGAVFEGSETAPQDETTPVAPRTPYAVAKARTLELIDEARTERGLFASAAILYNHESPLRGEGFVTRRITSAAARIAAGLMDSLELGNIDVCRDWGWAPDYVRGMRLMMEAQEPGDFVLATGRTHWLRDFLELAFTAAGVPDWPAHVRTRDDLRRTTDPTVLCGDSTKAQTVLGWTHTRDFAQIAQAMVEYDIRLLADPQALWHES